MEGAMQPCLTMFSDASVRPLTETSGWGFWIKGNGRNSMHGGGPLRRYSASTCVAELEAMANGLARARAADYFRSDDKLIMLQTDSAEALACLLHVRPQLSVSAHAESAPIVRRRKALDARRIEAVGFILTTLDDISLQPILRHVRGHKAGNGRNWVNRLCDKIAKEGAKKGRR